MVTLQPDELSHRQRICHTDPNSHPDRSTYAGLLYLFENEDLGGTGFYRWREPELVDKAKAIERENPVPPRSSFSNANIRREEISADQHCVIVDDFLQDPHGLVEFAAHHAGEFSDPQRGNYPGLLYRVDGDAMIDIYLFIRSKMTKHFPFCRGNMSLWTNLSPLIPNTASVATAGSTTPV